MVQKDTKGRSFALNISGDGDLSVVEEKEYQRIKWMLRFEVAGLLAMVFCSR